MESLSRYNSKTFNFVGFLEFIHQRSIVRVKRNDSTSVQ